MTGVPFRSTIGPAARMYPSRSNAIPGRSATKAPATNGRPPRTPRPLEDRQPRRVVEQVPEAGIHVDGRNEAGIGGAEAVRGEAIPVDFARGGERQEDRRDAGDLAAGRSIAIGSMAGGVMPPV